MRLRRGTYVDAAAYAEAARDPVCLHRLRVAAGLRRLDADAVASHRSAGLLCGLSLLDPPEVTVALTVDAGGETRSYPNLVVHRSRLPQGHRQGGAVPTTSAARTVVDLARTSSFREAVVAADSALARGLVRRGDLRQVLDTCAAWPGAHRAQRVVDFADGRAEAPSESLARILFVEQDLPAPVPQAEIVSHGRLVARVDFLFVEQGTVVEVDGRVKCQGLDAARVLWDEKRREDQIREAGYEVVRLTWAQIERDPQGCAARVRAAFARGSRRRAG